PSPPPPLLPSRSPSSPSGSALRGEREAQGMSKAQRGWAAGIERLVGDLRRRGAGRKLPLSSVIVELLVAVFGHGAATASPGSIHAVRGSTAAALSPSPLPVSLSPSP
ncbi:unnamed protein product, partial [Urochloa humidicola]